MSRGGGGPYVCHEHDGWEREVEAHHPRCILCLDEMAGLSARVAEEADNYRKAWQSKQAISAAYDAMCEALAVWHRERERRRAKPAAKMERDIVMLVWAILKRAGGTVRLDTAEIFNVPPQAVIEQERDPETGAVIFRAAMTGEGRRP